MGSNLIDETDHRYGRLVVLERAKAPTGKKLAFWLCRCDCGNTKVVAGITLRAGHIKSCGCLFKERTEKWQKMGTDAIRLPEGEASGNALFIATRQRAHESGREWGLSKEQVLSLAKQPCFYCGKEPQQSYQASHCNGAFVYNGLDRVDNDRGYTIDNVVPCCGTCNWAKRAMNRAEFAKWIITVYGHWAAEAY